MFVVAVAWLFFADGVAFAVLSDVLSAPRFLDVRFLSVTSLNLKR